jgi:hypothetical protein
MFPSEVRKRLASWGLGRRAIFSFLGRTHHKVDHYGQYCNPENGALHAGIELSACVMQKHAYVLY